MKKILIIEDDEQTRRNLATILRMEGYAALTAADGILGLDVARLEQPDLILCDVMMPRLDGHGVLKALRQDKITAGIPLIFLTARGEREDHRTGMNLGAADYLTKPTAASDLLAAIEARLNRNRLRPPPDRVVDSSARASLEGLGLTSREADVLLLMTQSKTNTDISNMIEATEVTVEQCLQEILKKLRVESREAAIARALPLLRNENLSRDEP
jgi:DNA-binding response OmpR family regulator